MDFQTYVTSLGLDMPRIIGVVIVLVVLLVLEIIMFGVIARMARARGDNGGSWVLVGLFISWPFALIILAISGKGRREEPKYIYVTQGNNAPTKEKNDKAETDNTPTTTVASAPTVAVKDESWVCSHCGKKNGKEYKYCAWCLTKKGKK